MNKTKFLEEGPGNNGVRKEVLLGAGRGRPAKSSAEKFTEKVTITLTKNQLLILKENVGHDRNTTTVLRDILQASGILKSKHNTQKKQS